MFLKLFNLLINLQSQSLQDSNMNFLSRDQRR